MTTTPSTKADQRFTWNPGDIQWKSTTSSASRLASKAEKKDSKGATKMTNDVSRARGGGLNQQRR